MGSHARPDNKTTSADHQLVRQGTQSIEQSPSIPPQNWHGTSSSLDIVSKNPFHTSLPAEDPRPPTTALDANTFLEKKLKKNRQVQ